MSTSHYVMLCEKMITLGFTPETPLVVIEQGTTAFHREYKSTIGSFEKELDPSSFASPCTMIVGDVARLAKDYGWKDAPKEKGLYFEPLNPPEEKYVA